VPDLNGLDPLAVIAIIIALASLIVSILTIARDRPRVKITYKTGWELVNPSQGYKSDTPYLSVSVFNKGIRPVTISSVGGKYLRYNGGFILSDSMIGGSKELTQGKRVDCLTEESNYLEILEKYGVLSFEAQDLTGKTYKKYVAPLYKRIIYWPVKKIRLMINSDNK
jgi:hypothetical protein